MSRSICSVWVSWEPRPSTTFRLILMSSVLSRAWASFSSSFTSVLMKVSDCRYTATPTRRVRG